MAHVWERDRGEVDMWAYAPYGSVHHGPKCKKCELQFCIECNPEFMETDCKQFMPA